VCVVASDGEWDGSTPVRAVTSHGGMTGEDEPIAAGADLPVEGGHSHVPVVDGDTVST